MRKHSSRSVRHMDFRSLTPEEIAKKAEIMEAALNTACGVPIEIMKTCAKRY